MAAAHIILEVPHWYPKCLAVLFHHPDFDPTRVTDLDGVSLGSAVIENGKGSIHYGLNSADTSLARPNLRVLVTGPECGGGPAGVICMSAVRPAASDTETFLLKPDALRAFEVFRVQSSPEAVPEPSHGEVLDQLRVAHERQLEKLAAWRPSPGFSPGQDRTVSSRNGTLDRIEFADGQILLHVSGQDVPVLLSETRIEESPKAVRRMPGGITTELDLEKGALSVSIRRLNPRLTETSAIETTLAVRLTSIRTGLDANETG